MPQTVEVRFKGTRRSFFTWADDASLLRLQEPVIVRVDRGEDLGRVSAVGAVAAKKCGGSCSCDAAPALGPPAAEEPAAETTAAEATVAEQPAAGTTAAETTATLPPVLRRASQGDIQRHNELRKSEEEHRRRAAAKVREQKLDMKVSDVEWQWDRHRMTVFFTAEQRVDFRSLVRELASDFRTRIDLRQIGVRDEAARLSGVGRCGREYCCSTWLTELSPVSLALAKDQHLSLNPTQISGGCGRLLCCLKYEHEFYAAAKKRFPREGKLVTTLRGAEKVIAVDIFRERILLRGADESRSVTLAELREEMEQAAGAVVGTPETAERAETSPLTPGRGEAQTPGRRDARTPGRRDAQPGRRDAQAPGRSDARTPGRADAQAPGRRDAPPAEPVEGADSPAPAPSRKRRRRRRRKPGQGGTPGPETQGA
jgi:cell fate regulator YaaT (PSP1 superfamily)